MSVIRAFIALPLPVDEAERIHHCTTAWRKDPDCEHLRWTPKTQFHLTLVFLGNVPVTSLEPLTIRLQEAAASFPSLILHLHQLGAFPSEHRPRVIWVGFGGAIDLLCRLQDAIQRAAANAGDHREDKPFHPHLTIARSPGHPPRTSPVARWFGRQTLEPGRDWTADHLHLIESRLSREGAVHNLRSVIRLAR